MVLAVQAHNEPFGYFFSYNISETESMSVQPGNVSTMIKSQTLKKRKEKGLSLR